MNGTPALATYQKREPVPQPGPPFVPTSAVNGTSVETLFGRIVLGNDVGGTAAGLFSDREIPMNGHFIALSGAIAKLLIGVTVPVFTGSELSVLGDFFLTNGAGAFIMSTATQGRMQLVGSNAQMIIGSEDFTIDANGSGDIHLQTGGATDRLVVFNDGRLSFQGSMNNALRQTAVAASFGVLDYAINCTAGTFALGLPTAVGCAGRVYIAKNSGAGVVTVTPSGGQTIDGAATVPLASLASVTVMSDGANWFIIT